MKSTGFKPFYNESIDGFDYYMCPECGSPLDEPYTHITTTSFENLTTVSCINPKCDYYYESCPDCGKPIIGGDNWSGVKCSDPECGWWFCY